MPLKDTISINTTPEKLYEWFMHFVENYKAWHPDHIIAKWIIGINFEKGSILYAEEYIENKIEKLKFRVIENIPNKLLKYKVLFPESLVCSGGSFLIEKNNNQSILTATLSFRLEKVLNSFFKKKIKAFQRHMKEEGENLKKILEK